MESIYMKLVEMSISASWLVLLVVILRLVLKKAPRWVHVALWALVAVRLLCPVTPESNVSLYPADLTRKIVEDIPDSYVGPSSAYWDHLPEFREAVDAGIEPIYAGEGHYYVVTGDTPQTPALTVRHIGSWVWICGMGLMLLWAWISYHRLKRKVSASIHVGNGVYLCDYIDTPFILGIFSPKIFLPSEMPPGEADHVLAHERAHISRMDHWWKPAGYAILTVYWFNPALWLAYILLCRDIELACDEKVIRSMDLNQKKAYSAALLNCSINRRYVAACPLAFGEVGVKERVKSVLNYRKPGFWLILVAVAALVITAVCFLTDPSDGIDEKTAQWFEEYAYEQVKDRMHREEVACLDGTDDYALVYCRGTGPSLTLYRYEKRGKDIEILDSGTGEYAISGGMSLNHLKSEGKHIYFGTVSQYHWNPEVEVNTWIVWNHLTLTEAGGKSHRKDMIGKEGFLFVLDTPMADFSAVDCLDTECLNRGKYTQQGYYMVETAFESEKGSPASIPYAWTSTLDTWDIRKCWAYQNYPTALLNTIEGSELNLFVQLINDVAPEEIISRGILGPDDPLWSWERPSVEILCTDGSNVRLRYVDDTVIIMPDTEFELWETDGCWVIENDALKQWMYTISLGGTQMLSDENREEIRRLVGQEEVTFFAPWEYEDLLFVGCWYDGGRGKAVACYEPLADGYRLRKLIREAEIKTCASGEDLYYCDYEDLRIFMILNQSITALEFAGDYRHTVSVEAHPGLAVAYFPETINAMYRFRYQNATTMYMDWNNQTHAQPPEYASEALVNPEDAYHVCSNLRLSDISFVWARDTERVDANYYRAVTGELSGRQMLQLLNILREIPENAYTQEDYGGEILQGLEICLHPAEDSEDPYPWITMALNDRAIYYAFMPYGEQSYQVWKIQDDGLVKFVESLLAGDRSYWLKFAPYPQTGGSMSFTGFGKKITVPKLMCFQYAHTDTAIRFKPENETSWMELRYWEEPYNPGGEGLKRVEGVYGGMEAVYGYYEGESSWRFMDISVSREDEIFHILLLKEDGIFWKKEYDREIYWMLENLAIGQNG